MLAARYKADGLHAVVDVNRFQEWGWGPEGGDEAAPVADLAAKWEAFGWRVFEADGHDHGALADAFAEAAATSGRPSVVLARTVKGKGYGLIESDPLRFHCATVEAHEHAQLMGSVDGVAAG